MSTYYEFYIGVNKGNKVEVIGPFIRKDGEYKLTPILTRSRSFIDWGDFPSWQLPVKMMEPDQEEYFTSESWMNESRYSISYVVSYYDVCSMADEGLVQGYVTLDELDFVAAKDYDPDILDDIWVRTPEMVAEMDPEMRREYGHIAFNDQFCTGYICRQLMNAIDPIELDLNEEDLCYVVRIC